MALTFSKDFYLVSITSFYTFYLIHTFGLSVQNAQLYLFLFLFSVAAGTVIGGPIGDRIGTRRVIWWSILGVLPFTLALPYVGLFGTAILSVIIGLILASAHPAIIVYAQSLIPGRVGMVAGLFFGLAFGVAGIGAAFLGWLADKTSIGFVYHVCAFLPAIGLLAAFLPEMAKPKIPASEESAEGDAWRGAISPRSRPPARRFRFFCSAGVFASSCRHRCGARRRAREIGRRGPVNALRFCRKRQSRDRARACG